MALSLDQIETRVAQLDGSAGPNFVFDLLAAYGLPKASITRLRTGAYNRGTDGDVLWKGKVFRRYVAAGEQDLHAAIDGCAAEPLVQRESPRFLLVHDDRQVLAVDRITGDTLDTTPDRLASHSAFFLPWAGIEKARRESVNPADLKAAEKMARIYEEIIRHNAITSDRDVHDLNLFFSRLLFCFFAEDTGVFDKGSFTGAIASYTRESGEDVAGLLRRIFAVLDMPRGERDGVPEHLRHFGYVNGRLFETTVGREGGIPTFSAKARRLVLECGSLDWSSINPDIFGSMMQAVVRAENRGMLGMHYTSVENILKVLRPLVLDDLEYQFANAVDDARRLSALLERLARIRIFDPACGSGNFLIVAYKELRRLEHRVLRRRAELDSGELMAHASRQLFPEPVVRLEHFYGIEVDHFAHEIARLSLWLAKHQMNLEYRELFDLLLPLIPLKEGGRIHHANAARLDWSAVLARSSDEEICVLGNPPYVGGTLQTEIQKQDLLLAIDDPSVNKYLDYVSIWLVKGAAYVKQQNAELGFVTTNSVCQGNHVGLLWPHIAKRDVEISFAHSSFLWSNQARGRAGVTCIVLGLAPQGRRSKKIYDGKDGRREVDFINPYLVPDGPDLIVTKANAPLNDLPPMVFGSMPRDGGHLTMRPQERDELVRMRPEAARFVRRYTGADEFLSGRPRYCLWIRDEDAAAASAIPEIAERLEKVREMRLDSVAASTRAAAEEPHRFVQRAHQETQSIIVPGHSSELRKYVPMGFLDAATVISNGAFVVYGAEAWIFGLLQSRMHMVWLAAVGGRLETRYRYASGLVYNTFPVPTLSSQQKEDVTEAVFGVLEVREQHSSATLAELYDVEKMPLRLHDAHDELDAVVDSLYRQQPFETDDERLVMLFELYADRARTGA